MGSDLLFRCALLLCTALVACGIVLGRHGKEDPGSNFVQTSLLLFPQSNDKPICKTDQSLFGQCVDVRLCYAARQAVNTGNHPVRCGWINNYIPKVCCHPEQVQRPKLVFRPHGSISY